MPTSAPDRAVLWDMDGTLLDSADYHWRAWHAALAAEGYELTRERFDATFGQRNDTILRALFGPAFPLSAVARIGDSKEAAYRALVYNEGVSLLPGVATWLTTLHQTGWGQAIASAAPRKNIETIVTVLGIGAYFAALVGAEDVERGKPDPQVFLTAAARLGVAPAQCIVVEDAPAGLEGARRAGMRCIGVLTSHAHLTADCVVYRLNELEATVFDGLVAKRWV